MSVFLEQGTKEIEKTRHVFSVPRKRVAERVEDPGEGTSSKTSYRPIIPGLSPIEWTVVVYPRNPPVWRYRPPQETQRR